MTTETPTLTDFLLARIAEDEAVAKAARPSGGDDTWTTWVCDEFDHVAMGEDRMLAECEAKRTLVQTFDGHLDEGDGYAVAATIALEAMALPFADHPDYRAEWRP